MVDVDLARWVGGRVARSGAIILLGVARRRYSGHGWVTFGGSGVFLNADVDMLAYWACVVSKRWKLLEDDIVRLGLAGYHMLPQVVGDDVLDVIGSGVALRSCWMRDGTDSDGW